ncbi:hypothetical protein FOA43_000871 [Brettanomyces nanus]|uniref:Nuclear condensin complex subunit 3 C-terminal domain-containing protein n=1 Tax=Eeniella nana TaxID=13502 RepID=A0A875S119_EENNA|nr:uncharacterized protein FOA43_000871 [Brettanomyces nanus]QPG73559.1 hypothetical protein FOA43_000871 [Brettanomyces nanus]
MTSAHSGKRYIKSLNDLNDEAEIEKAFRQTFQEAQRTVSVHKTQVAILRTIYQRCQEIGHSDQFNNLFCRLLNKILPVKRNEPVADRIVKFVSSFTTAINPSLKRDGTEEESTEIDQEEDDAFSNFIAALTTHLMKGLDASNKNVRYGVCHLLSHLMHNMSVIDKDLYDSLSQELLNRIYDKEPSVRIKAITTLASFQEPDGTETISDAARRIKVIMQNDLNPEVRRACLKQLEKNEYTKPYIFERARDINSVNRRLIFSFVLPRFGDFRTIGAEDRNRLLAWGLRDRDETVRKAAVKWLTDSWLPTLNNDLLEFVERLKVIDSEIAETALRALVDHKPEIIKKLSFNQDVLKNLTSEYALLYRVFFQYCNDNHLDDILDKKFPEAAEFVEVLQFYFKQRAANLRKIEEHKEELQQSEVTAEKLEIIDPEEYDFVILQLLIIASEYDYHDEFGRSNMLNVLRSILSQEGLNEKIVNVLILCIKKLSISERDFSQMIVEIINDIRDTAYEKLSKSSAVSAGHGPVDESIDQNDDDDDDDDDAAASDSDDSNNDDEFVDAATSLSRASIRSANKSREKELEKETKQVAALPSHVLVECLVIAKRMLELVKEPLSDNMYLESILHNLIRPSLQRSEVEIRVLSLTSMGLCCILDKDLAIRNMFLCGVFITKSDNDQLIMVGLKVIADLLAVHGVSILGVDVEGSIDAMAVAKLFYRTLRDNKRKEVQAVSGEALYKLFLSGIINDDELFETTLLAYFNPSINDNEALKQCLSFCIPVYAFSHVAHQEQISRVVSDTLSRLFDSWSEMEEEAGTAKTLNPQSVIQQIMYWTDPYRVVNRDPEDAEKSSVQIDVGLQLLSVLSRYDVSSPCKPFVKAIFTMLPKLTFTELAGLAKLQELLTALNSDDILQGDLDEALKNSYYRNSYGKFKLYVEECVEKAKELENVKGEAKVVEHNGEDEVVDDVLKSDELLGQSSLIANASSSNSVKLEESDISVSNSFENRKRNIQGSDKPSKRVKGQKVKEEEVEEEVEEEKKEEVDEEGVDEEEVDEEEVDEEDEDEEDEYTEILEEKNAVTSLLDDDTLGCGILTTYAQVANIAGIQGLLVYALTGAVPIVLFAFFGPLIRKRCPDGFVLTEWCYQRFGVFTGLYLSLFTILTMFLFMVSELTAINGAINALTGLDATPCIVVECVVTTIYTFLGGFKVSFTTDTFQALFVLVLLVVGVIGYALNIHVDSEIKHATKSAMLGSNKVGWMLLYILLVAIITNDAFMSGFWLRTFAAKTDKDLLIACSIASFVCAVICTLAGLPGIYAVWTGDLTIGDDNGYNAFFILCASMENWIIGVVLVFSVALSTCTFDSLQSATASSISNDIFRNKFNVMWARVVVVIIMVPSLVVAIEASANVLQIYFIADLVSSSVIPIMFLGLWNKMYFLRGLDVIVGGLGALLAVFVFGTIYYGSAKEGGKLLLIWNGIYSASDWGGFGAFVIAPFAGILFGMMCSGVRIGILRLYSKHTGRPFTALDKPFKLAFGVPQHVIDADSDDTVDVERITVGEKKSKKKLLLESFI